MQTKVWEDPLAKGFGEPHISVVLTRITGAVDCGELRRRSTAQSRHYGIRLTRTIEQLATPGMDRFVR